MARTCSSGIRGSQGRGARGSSSRAGGVTRRAEYRPTGLRRGSFPVPFSALSPFSPEQRTPRSDLKGRFQPAQGGQRTPGHVHRKGSTSSSLPVSTPAPTAASRFAGTTHRARHRRACTCVGFLPGNGFRVFGSGFGEAGGFLNLFWPLKYTEASGFAEPGRRVQWTNTAISSASNSLPSLIKGKYPRYPPHGPWLLLSYSEAQPLQRHVY